MSLYSPAPIYDDLEKIKLAESLTFMRDELGADHALVKKALAGKTPEARAAELIRSEEHTSELQSQSNLVCRLLLEKKKQQHQLTLFADRCFYITSMLKLDLDYLVSIYDVYTFFIV